MRLVLSFGDSADIKNAGSVSISSGIATFSPSVPNPIGSASITAGDVVSYGSSSCYLYQRISDLVWIVKTITGGAPADTDGKLSVHSIKKAFSSPSTLSSDIQNSLGSLLLTHYNPIVDLTKAKLQIDIAFSQSTTVLSSPVTMSSFICDAVNFVRLYTPNDIVNECYVSQGHGGIYYHTNLSVGTGSFVALTSTGINFLTIDGLTIHKADDSNTLINIASGANCRVVNNILDGGATSINVPSTTLVMNNESLHAATNGILCGSNCNILNNTIVSAGLGVNNASTSSLVENNIFQSCTTWITNTANAYNNTYSNSDSSPINNNLSASTTFKNPSGGDYSPNKTDSAVLGNAISIPGHMTDARGKTRGRNWDRGALEYTPNIVFFSVGKKYYDGINKGVGVDSDIDIINGIAIFKNPQTSKYICCGDQVSFGIGGSPSYVYLKEKIDSNRWYVTTVNGTIPGDILGGHLTYIDRSYNSFSDAFLVLNQNLVTNNIQINLACCEFNDSTVSATLNANTDLDHYFRIFTANSAKECNESFRHKGLLDTNYFMFNFFNGVVISISSPFTELEGLQVYDTAAYCFEIATYNCYISKNIFVGTGVAISSVSPTSGYISNFVSADNIIINNLIYQSAWDGIKISSASVLNHYNVFLANNTIYECNGHGIKIIKSASNTDCTCSVINNIIQNSGYSDVSIDNNQYDLINNITSDDTSLTFPNYIVQFQNLPSLNFQLDRIKEKRAIKNAIDLSSYAIFTDDIIGTNRASGLWDIGAFQLSDIVSTSASLRFGPFRLKLQHASITKNIPFVILNLVHSGADSVSKFSSIHDMNTVLATNFSDFNVIIYVQKTSSGQSFLSQDAFQFGSIGSPIGTVVVMSNPLDTNVENLPSKIEFTGNFAGDAQDHSNSSIKIDQLHIAMHGYAMLGSSYLLGSLTIEDSIIETSNASLSDPVGTVINVINSDVDYHGSQTNVYLGSYTGTANNIMINSVILSNCGSALTFGITNKSTVVTDQIINCLTFNNGNAIIPNSNLYPDNIINCHWMVDPEFVGYIPKLTSPLVENGSDSVLKAPFFLTNSYTGAPRKINLHVDIGAYEAVIRSRFINASDIKNIYQKKIVYVNASTPYYATVGADRVFKDLYSDTGVSTVQGAEEIVRESSIIIELNDTQNDFVYISDKPFEVVRTFEAYYDIGTNTVVVKKQPSFDGKIFKNIFSVDEYIFYFDQAKHSLIVYMNDTFQKGVSGVGNPVNNVKIGGRPMLNGTI